jgi:hypothetical protein
MPPIRRGVCELRRRKKAVDEAVDAWLEAARTLPLWDLRIRNAAEEGTRVCDAYLRLSRRLKREKAASGR